jgi:XTP/dITP diphosphohydrolase
MNRRLLIATNNKGKIEEMRALLEPAKLELITPHELGINLEVEEDGSSYAENAIKKASAFTAASGIISMADDSGLEVAVLDGAPGMYSARYSPKPGARDADRRSFLLQNLQASGAPRPWKAQFHATIAVASPDGTVQLSEGLCPGEIIPEERGEGGFGYDPIFLLPELGLTMAELTQQDKNKLSHRGRAVRSAIPLLLRFYDQ